MAGPKDMKNADSAELAAINWAEVGQRDTTTPEQLRAIVLVDPDATLGELYDLLAEDYRAVIDLQARDAWIQLGRPHWVVASDLGEAIRMRIQERVRELESEEAQDADHQERNDPER